MRKERRSELYVLTGIVAWAHRGSVLPTVSKDAPGSGRAREEISREGSDSRVIVSMSYPLSPSPVSRHPLWYAREIRMRLFYRFNRQLTHTLYGH